MLDRLSPTPPCLCVHCEDTGWITGAHEDRWCYRSDSHFTVDLPPYPCESCPSCDGCRDPHMREVFATDNDGGYTPLWVEAAGRWWLFCDAACFARWLEAADGNPHTPSTRILPVHAYELPPSTRIAMAYQAAARLASMKTGDPLGDWYYAGRAIGLSLASDHPRPMGVPDEAP